MNANTSSCPFGLVGPVLKPGRPTTFFTCLNPLRPPSDPEAEATGARGATAERRIGLRCALGVVLPTALDNTDLTAGREQPVVARADDTPDRYSRGTGGRR